MAHGLDGVGVEHHPGLAADRPQLPDGLDGADLVVGIHDADQAGVGAQGLAQLVRRDQPLLPHLQQGDLEAFGGQLVQGVEHGVVFKGRGDDVFFAPGRTLPGGAAQGLVVGLAAA